MRETQTERTLQNRIAARELVHGQMEDLLRELDDATPSETQADLLKKHRSDLKFYDDEIATLSEQVDADRAAAKKAEEIRRAAAAAAGVADVDDNGIVYRDFSSYARDFIITRTSPECSKISTLVDRAEIQRAAERMQLLERVSNTTISTDVAGLQPAQHIAEIFQVIDSSRPIVASARRSTLVRGSLTYPKLVTRPVVAVQGSELTEGGDTELNISMQTATASTYLGGGNLSWQAINWSTPDALTLWFEIAAADYALKTEQDAAQVMQHSGFTYNASTLLDGTDTYDDWVAAIVSGCSEVYANSGRLANTLYLAPNAFYALAGAIPETVPSAFLSGGLALGNQSGGFSGLSIVVSRGMDSGVAVVGDSSGLLVAETAGAPVELRVVEPAIGGVEVGIIGAFEAVVVDPGAFAMISTAS